MKRYAKLALAALLSAAALALTSCAADETVQNGNTGPRASSPEATQEATTTVRDGETMGGMDHGSGGMASEMLMEDGGYSDERFIDMMVPHHQGAVEMAEVALRNAEHEEIR